MKRITKEEYIETIHMLQKEEGKAQTGRIASRLGVKPPSVTQMLAKLQAEDLVAYEPYLGAKLTAKGGRLATDLMARHKVIADFLEILGVEREAAEKDACVIEHHMSKVSAIKLKQFVEFIQSAPRDPQWIERFRRYCDTGERVCSGNQ
jgi:DtxR family Mn-dependent transcriptional regulator